MPYLGNGLTKFTTADDLTVSGDAAIDTTTLVVDSTNNRVGIGNASPSDALHIKTTADADIGLQVQNDDTQAFCKVQSGGTALYGGNGGVNFVSGGSFATRMGITSGGNVNIGTTTSTRSPLVIANSSSQISLTDADGSSNIVDIRKQSGPSLTFDINGGEKMRLDSSGNVLFNKTAEDTGTDGIELNRNDVLIATRNGDAPLLLNRRTSDGEIAVFRKDNSTIGSVASYSSTIQFGQGNANLKFSNSADTITPVNGSGTDNNNALDLGTSSARFKDGYFNSYVYANYFAGVGDTDTLIEFPGSNVIKFVINGAERMRIANSTNVGINESSPDRQLHVNGGSANVVAKFESTDSTAAIEFTDNGGSAEIGTVNGAVVFFPGGAQKGLISSDGTLLLNQSAIAGIATATDSNSHEIGPGYMVLNRDDTATVTQIAFGKNGSIVGGISTTGSATSLVTSSDRRLKSNIQDAASASDKIDALQVRQFDWNVDGSHQDYGLVAQELQPIEPMAVSGSADSDEMMGVDYSKLVPMLLKEIQQLRSRVAALEE